MFGKELIPKLPHPPAEYGLVQRTIPTLTLLLYTASAASAAVFTAIEGTQTVIASSSAFLRQPGNTVDSDFPPAGAGTSQASTIAIAQGNNALARGAGTGFASPFTVGYSSQASGSFFGRSGSRAEGQSEIAANITVSVEGLNRNQTIAFAYVTEGIAGRFGSSGPFFSNRRVRIGSNTFDQTGTNGVTSAVGNFFNVAGPPQTGAFVTYDPFNIELSASGGSFASVVPRSGDPTFSFDPFSKAVLTIWEAPDTFDIENPFFPDPPVLAISPAVDPNAYEGLLPSLVGLGTNLPIFVRASQTPLALSSAPSLVNTTVLFEADSIPITGLQVPGIAGGPGVVFRYGDTALSLDAGTFFDFSLLPADELHTFSIQGSALSETDVFGLVFSREGVADLRLTFTSIPEPATSVMGVAISALLLSFRDCRSNHTTISHP